jgi:hypothetical protein
LELQPVDTVGVVVVAAPCAISELDVVYEILREASVTFEPKDFSGEDAEGIVSVADAIGRLSASIKLRAAGRVEETGHYEHQGHRTAGQWLAGKTGEPTGKSISDLEALKAAERHPVVENALRKGELSIGRARQISSAADRFPDKAKELVEASLTQGHHEFTKNCDTVRFASRSTEDEITRHERMRRSRSCRLWTDPEGFGRIDAKLTTDAFAVVKGTIEGFEREVFSKARKDGAHESRQAYLADALVEMAKASGSGTPVGTTTKSATTKTLVRIRVDLDALMRGYAEAGEVCEIPGVGRVSVPIARAVLGESLLELVITNGKDVSTVVSDSRYIRKALNIALEERDPTCVVPGCNATDFLQRDHWRKDFAKKGKTEIDNLARLCGFHHRQKTHGGWVLGGGPGSWYFEEVYVRTPGSTESFESEEDPPQSGHDPPESEHDPPEPTQLF